MAKTKIGSNAQFTGLSAVLNSLGEYVYAYSQTKIFDDDPQITLLEFNTGKRIIKSQWFPYRTDTDSLDSRHTIYFNGLEVLNLNMSSGAVGVRAPVELIIPPLTHVKVTIYNIDNTSNGYGACSMIGEYV